MLRNNYFILLFFALIVNGNYYCQNISKKVIMVSDSKSNIIIKNSDSTKFYNLHFGLWDSILSNKSTDDLDVYSTINVKIDYNPFKQKYIAIWKIENGRILQTLEIDSCDSGSGIYNYFSSFNVTGEIRNGMKNGLQFEYSSDAITRSQYVNGMKNGTETTFYHNTQKVREIYYNSNTRSRLEFWYYYEDNFLNLFDYVDWSITVEGNNEIIVSNKKIMFKKEGNRVKGNVKVINLKNNVETIFKQT